MGYSIKSMFAPVEVTGEVLERFGTLAAGEDGICAELLKGGKFSEVYDRFQIG